MNLSEVSLHFGGPSAIVPVMIAKSTSESKTSREVKVEGLKYFAVLKPLLDRLHEDETARDKAGNRVLHYDQYCMLVLLYVLNPTVSSLRALAQASELTKVQRKLGTTKTSLGSLSEASRLFDAGRLKQIIADLATSTLSTGDSLTSSGIRICALTKSEME